ncbi:MAG: methionine ABC transporter ATP-binding protein [Fibrobacteres bacterium CG2_30_45_31]|nr:MAG: methionine ABC transporter ATP-binding protein [Fibrobacteres bacterium CG2_30_45_31]
MLKLNNISVTFQSHGQVVHAVQHVTLHVKRGEIYGIIGSSGAGKSTLIRTVNLLERPESGEVIVRGTDISHLNGLELRKARQKIGMIFQHFNLIGSKTVHDNIALPLRAAGVSEDEIRVRVPELLSVVELTDKEFAYPGQLSGGQKQRVGIARALANNPDILLGDEPTSALDLETTESILKLLADINQRLGVTILLITHEMQVVKKICHRVAVMQGGEIVEENEVYELFSNPQHPLTQELVAKSLDLTLPKRVAETVQGDIIRLVYLGDNAERGVLSDTLRAHRVQINILHGHIEYINDKPIGILIISLVGDPVQIENATEHLKGQVAKLEVIRHG